MQSTAPTLTLPSRVLASSIQAGFRFLQWPHLTHREGRKEGGEGGGGVEKEQGEEEQQQAISLRSEGHTFAGSGREENLVAWVHGTA